MTASHFETALPGLLNVRRFHLRAVRCPLLYVAPENIKNALFIFSSCTMVMIMADLNLARLDLNLLPQLAALLRRCNVTHAANDVGLSQPAMSRALARMRDELGDPLLVRGTKGLVRTPRAERLLPRLEAALADVKALFVEPEFDPAHESRTIAIAGADVHSILLGPIVTRRLANEAPNVRLRFESYTPDLVERMERGALDLAFALTTTPLPPGAMTEPVAQDRLALVMRRTHPARDRDWTVVDYGTYTHAVVAFMGDGRSDLDTVLAAHGVTRRIGFIAPTFSAVLATVAATDMVTTISRTFASHFVDAFDLTLREPPFEATHLATTLVWHAMRNRDPLLMWVRGLIRAAADEAYGGLNTPARD